jgi:hypothetical protein
MNASGEQILLEERQVYLFTGPISPLKNLRKLLTFQKFKDNCAVVLTNTRLAFLKSQGFLKDVTGPILERADQLDDLIAKQGGLTLPAAEIKTLSTKSGGPAPISDWRFVHEPAQQEYTVRFFDVRAAERFAQALRSLERLAVAPVQPPSTAEWKFLGLPVEFGLPAPAGQGMEVAYGRSVIVMACRQILAEKPDLAIHDAEKLIKVPAHRDNPAAAPFVAVAYYLRGLARLKKNDLTGAREDMETCVRMAPQYLQARQKFQQLQSG